MTHVGYLVAGWSVGLGGLGLYALSLVARGRRLSRQVPIESRRWMESPNEPAGRP
jgi:hypothetical protein